MKNLLLLCTCLFFIACTPKPFVALEDNDTLPSPPQHIQALIDRMANVDSVAFEKVNIGLLEGLNETLFNDSDLRGFHIDSVTVDLKGKKYNINNNVLELGYTKFDTMTIFPGTGKIVDKLPYRISGFTMKKIILKEGDWVIKTIYIPSEIVEFEIDKYDVKYNPNRQTLKKLHSQIDDLTQRILNLLDEIKRIEEIEPNHAASGLPPTLHSLLEKIKKINQYYSNQEDDFINNRISVDFDKLYDVEYTVEVQEQEVDDPNNYPTIIENELLFATGKYKIPTTNSKLDKIVVELQNKIKNIEIKYANKFSSSMDIKIVLSVIGYSDKQDVGDSLRDELKEKYSVSEKNISQEERNRMLSQARADEVFSYIKNKIDSGSLISLSFIKTEAIGKGWEYPPNVKPPCPNSCQARRVVNISHIVFPDTKIE